MEIKNIVASLAIAAFSSSSAYAEDINAIFKRVNDLVAAQNYSKALDELKWASKEIEKLNTQKLQQFLPDTLNGFTAEKVQANSALGITNLERNYKGPGNVSVKIALTNMGGGGAGNPLGGIAQFGQMAAMMGAQNGSDTFRIQGRTATLETQDDSADLTIFLESGSILKLEQQGSAKGETLKAMAEALKLEDMDKYIKGVS